MQNVGCKIRCSRIKTNLSLYMYYTRLLNVCQSFLWIISALFILFSYVSSFADRLVSPADSPSPQGLFLSPVSYLSGQLVAKYKLISQRALADFARGALHAPLNPRLLNPRHGISFRFRVIKPCSCYAHAMPTVCPCHAHGMPMLCPCHAHGMPISCTILWAWLYCLAESKIQALC